jgi:RNA polymerase sigma factor (sigma-70 family)
VTQPIPDQQLISAYRQGNQDAATALFERYYARLLELIRRQLGWQLKEVEGSTDVAQSVLRSFFSQIGGERVQLGPSDSLWPLLVTIALNKVRNLGKYWQREKRDLSRQVALEADNSDPLERGPSPQDAAAVKELVDQLLAPFSERRRKIIELILEGESVGDIASKVGTTERTVYSTRRAAGQILEQVLAAGSEVSTS